jgi:hypothetical protein
VSFLRDSVFTEEIQLNWISRLGLNPMYGYSFEKREIWIKRLAHTKSSHDYNDRDWVEASIKQEMPQIASKVPGTRREA